MTRNPMSLVLVTVDCLRADHCGFYGYARPTTPFLDSLAAESLVAPAAIVAGAPTYFSFPAILASRMPLALGRDVIGLAPGEPTLATTLRQAGHATAAFSAANPYISARFGYNQGFDTFKDFLDFDRSSGPPAKNVQHPEAAPRSSKPQTITRLNYALNATAHALGLGGLYDELYFQYRLRVAAPAVSRLDELRKFPSAETIVDHAITWLSSHSEQPFFLWLHLMDPHSPYYPAPSAFRDLTGGDPSASQARYWNEFWNRSDLTAPGFARGRNSVLDLYDAGIRSVDNQIARLGAHLTKTGHWGHCAFVLTADHGEEFLDHGRRYHAPAALNEELIRVPLLIRTPTAARKQMPATPFSHLHLAPTLLEMLGVAPPADFQGTSLWQNLEQALPWDSPALSECVQGCTNPLRRESRSAPRLLSVRSERYKLVVQLAPGAAEQIYDLASDPKEVNPLPPGVARDARKALLQAAHRYLQECATRRNPVARLTGRLRDLRLDLESISRVV